MEGRVEVFHLGIWGTVCNDAWDILDATVVCRELGYTTAVQAYRAGNGSGQIWYDNVACNGYETRLVDCQSNGLASHNCFHFLDAGVACAGESGTHVVQVAHGLGQCIRLVLFCRVEHAMRTAKDVLSVFHNARWLIIVICACDICMLQKCT